MNPIHRPSWHASIHHDGARPFVSQITPRLGETVTIRVRHDIAAPVHAVYLRTVPDGEQSYTPMKRAEREGVAQWWEAQLLIREPCINYRFLLKADDGVWFYSANGITAYPPLDYTDFKILADYHAPGWLEEAVFYQIFPDYFANGDPSNDPSPELYEYMGARPRTYGWGDLFPPDAPRAQSYYGGDLEGVRQHLDYLEALGINAIYFAPLLTAYSAHRYDTVDYEHIDPVLGGDEAMIALQTDLEQRGIRYIMDIVPNHCGSAHPWFVQAQANPDAPECDYFFFRHHPNDYAYWGPFPHLVKLNYTHPDVRAYMYENEDAVFRRWLKPPFKASGWRVDVGNMLGRLGAIQVNAAVIRSIRAAVKSTDPDAYLMGENFHDASPQLQGDQWDGVMNYRGFAIPLMNWLSGFGEGALNLDHNITSPVPFKTEALLEHWQLRLAAVPWVIARQQFNLLGSHDTGRLWDALGGNTALIRLAITVQLTFPGIPCIYYGDEIGLRGIPGLSPMDGGSRPCMEWNEEKWNHDLLAFFRDLIDLRRTSPILREGGFQLLVADEDTFAYARLHEVGNVVVVAHRGAASSYEHDLTLRYAGITDGTQFRERFSGVTAVVANGALPIGVQLQGASIWESN